MKIWITILFLFSFKSYANDVADLRLKALLSSSSESQLQNQLKINAALVSLSKRCEEELQSSQLPSSCYDLLFLQRDHQLVSKSQNDKRQQSLDGFCRRIVKNIQELQRLEKFNSNEKVSGKCRALAVRRLEDLKYQLGDVRELDRFLN